MRPVPRDEPRAYAEPTLLKLGALDQDTGMSLRERMDAASTPGAMRLIIEGAHALVQEREQERLTAELETFVDRIRIRQQLDSGLDPGSDRRESRHLLCGRLLELGGTAASVATANSGPPAASDAAPAPDGTPMAVRRSA